MAERELSALADAERGGLAAWMLVEGFGRAPDAGTTVVAKRRLQSAPAKRSMEVRFMVHAFGLDGRAKNRSCLHEGIG
jgi:hypothetical protein